jgi:RNA-directed DNA polymerase
MKESHIEGVATHDDPESCADGREAGREALTGAHTGSVLSREITKIGAPTLLSKAEGETSQGRYRKSLGGPARSETRYTCGTSLRENREIPSPPAADGVAGRSGKAIRPWRPGGGSSPSGRRAVPTVTLERARGSRVRTAHPLTAVTSCSQ